MIFWAYVEIFENHLIFILFYEKNYGKRTNLELINGKPYNFIYILFFFNRLTLY